MSNESKYAIASRLAQFLRRNGEKVINGSCKLSLTTSALCLLNTLFAETVSNANYSLDSNASNSVADSDVAADVKFLFDFMKRTSSLKLFHGVQTLRGGIDLSHFSNLSVLELRKIPAHLIVGLDTLSFQLKSLNVSRSLYLLKEIFGPCGEEESLSNTWLELKELNLSYNYLETLDASLHSLPNVEVIDLSHNHLSNVTDIRDLKRLTIVNLSYNELSCLPMFEINSCRTLTKLYCRNNNLEDLEGLDCLFNLQELDVGYNLLSEYHVLQPLDKLKSLRKLNLEGNPLYFHRRHVSLVAGFIHKNVLYNGFVLNGHNFSFPFNEVSENKFKEIQVPNQHQTSINTVVGDTDSIVSAPYNPHHFGRSYSDQSSCESHPYFENSYEKDEDEPIVHVKKVKKKVHKMSSKNPKTKKTKYLMTEDPKNDQHQENGDQVDNTVPVPSHLKTKALMEARREELGHTWLIPDSNFQRVMLPTPEVPANTPASSSVPPIQTISQTSLVEKVNSSFASQAPEALKKPVLSDQVEAIKTPIKEVPEDISEEQDQKENDDIEILSSNCEPDCCSGNHHGTKSQDDLSDCDIYENNELFYVDEFSGGAGGVDSEEESEDSIFFVTRLDEFSENAVSIYVGPNYIKEKDVLTAKVIDRLDLKCLQCVITSSKVKDESRCCQVELEFNTVKSSRRKRIYIFDNFESGMIMANKVQPFADANTLEEVTLGALECVKCKSQFSKQVAKKILIKDKKPNDDSYSSSYDSNKVYCREIDACPNCDNTILVNLDTFPMPGIRPSSVESSKGISTSSPHNMSPSAGGILANLFPSMRISPILKRKSVSVAPSNLTQSLVLPSCSTIEGANLSQTNETDEPGSMRRISSDMTIMSNTSQSSIAVIPDPDVNLHSIVEQNSQSSLSPPVSHDSTYFKANNTSELEGLSEALPGNQNTLPKQMDPSKLNENEPDFYSISNTSTHSSSKNLKIPTVSSGSEYYVSPSRSNASGEPDVDFKDESKEVDEVSKLLNILGEKRTITHEAFSEIDHRLKLHLDINIFKDDEELEACLQTSIVPLLTGDEFTGLFAITSKKIYVFKFLPAYNLTLHFNESLDKVVQIIHSTSINQLKQIKVILGSQGLTLAFGPNARVFTLMIRDADICNSFTSLISDFVQEHPSVCGEVEFLSSAEDTLPALKEAVFPQFEEMPEILLHLFAYSWNNLTQESDASHPVCVIVTSENLYISRILCKKQDTVQDLSTFCTYHYLSVSSQQISDLVSMKLKKDLKSIEVHFLDESSGHAGHQYVVSWTIKTETKSALFSLISALKAPWEEIFGVPLSLTYEENKD